MNKKIYGFPKTKYTSKVISSLTDVQKQEYALEDKDIIIYKFGAGYNGREISKLIGRDPDYVYKRLQRAIQKLQKIL